MDSARFAITHGPGERLQRRESWEFETYPRTILLGPWRIALIFAIYGCTRQKFQFQYYGRGFWSKCVQKSVPRTAPMELGV